MHIAQLGGGMRCWRELPIKRRGWGRFNDSLTRDLHMKDTRTHVTDGYQQQDILLAPSSSPLCERRVSVRGVLIEALHTRARMPLKAHRSRASFPVNVACHPFRSESKCTGEYGEYLSVRLCRSKILATTRRINLRICE